MSTHGPFLWYLNRSTGLVLVCLLSLSLVLGVLATRGDRTSGRTVHVPRFAMQLLHRNLALLTTVLLVLHVASAVVDEYVDIRWWQSVLPLHLHYRPLWLALGIVALDLVVASVLTSLVRDRLPVRLWRLLHLTAYPVWVLAMAHGLGIGTDTGAGWARWIYVACGVAVLLAALLRVSALAASRRERSAPGASIFPGALR